MEVKSNMDCSTQTLENPCQFGILKGSSFSMREYSGSRLTSMLHESLFLSDFDFPIHRELAVTNQWEFNPLNITTKVRQVR